ncbi:ribosome maturation factor RimP [Gordonia araii NBRC 100433]|uniref:Ribosome maturation factor RimP n=1 Tax=Gordonia araii NBRC 100433 TaxID=1073574 RepID=G7H4Y1_9ACTN|nr:ribosome maturation factor RimP [Gordonia araii]NNG96596.1 ribosome maturation factor RimP [Gordonia araii NBRC 100433]GAB10906.1 ribosome maturation factor RimP [Gordonia araii NBRC 100433]
MAPDADSVAKIVTPIIEDTGLEVDGLSVVRRPGRGESVITVVVDGDDGVGLDALTELTRAITAAFDEQSWAQDYALDVTSRGVDSPLTKPQHWRRNRERKAQVVVRGAGGSGAAANDEKFTGRIGNLVGDTVSLVVNQKGRIAVREVALDDVVSAVVVVEFGEPSKAELDLCRESAGE